MIHEPPVDDETRAQTFSSRTPSVYLMLQLVGPDLDPNDVTANLGLIPTRAFRKGDPFMAGGRTQQRAYGGWAVSTTDENLPEDIATHARLLRERIRPILPALSVYLTTPGIRVSIVIWWEPTDGPTGFSLPSDEMRELALFCHQFDFHFA